ncbi:MAG: hypothetical protein MZV70_46545 [Desulfobacterales bacterium]|nr:hypothetical protein [Desulfobacterales bacterium]
MILGLGLDWAAPPRQPNLRRPQRLSRDEADNPLAKVVLKMVERMNARRPRRIAGLLFRGCDGLCSGFASYRDGSLCRGKSSCAPSGRIALATISNGRSLSLRVDGNVVSVSAKTWHDFTRQLGVAHSRLVRCL